MADLWPGNFRSCCRLCLNDNRHHLRPIFDGTAKERDLPHRISQFVSVKVSPNDKLSTLLCRDCIRRLDAWSQYHQSCVSNQIKLCEWMKRTSGLELMDQSIQIKSEPLDTASVEDGHEIEQLQFHIKDEPIDHDELEQDDFPPHLLPYQIMEEHMSEDSMSSERPRLYTDDTFCVLCNKSFSNAANKRRHDTYLHNKEKTPMQRSQITEIPRINTTPEKNTRKPFPTTIHVEENGTKETDGTEEPQVNASMDCTTDNSIEASENNSIEDNIEDTKPTDITEEPDEEKSQFVASLKLVRKDSPTPMNHNNNTENGASNLSKIEVSYSEKCRAMVNMYTTLECACHNVQHANLRGLLSHLRALRIWFPLFTCYHCMISFTDRATYSRHTVRCTKKQLDALVKLSELKERSSIKRRLYQNFKCNRCNYLYTFYEEYCHHINEEHSTGDPPFFCTSCRERFDEVQSYRKHVYSQCMIAYYCDICFVTTDSLEEFEQHAKEHHDQSEGFVLLQDDNYVKYKRDRTHVVTTSPRVDPAIADEHAVEIIGKRERRQSSRNPNMIPHPESDDDGQSQTPPSKLPKLMSTKGPTKCPVCEKEYSNSFNMIRHYKKAHPELLGQMNLNISRTSDAGAESLEDEQDPSYYSCPDCGGVYDSQSWSQHVKSHPLHQCGDCSKTFQFKTELEHHRTIHLTLKISRDAKTHAYKTSMLSPEDEEDMHMCEVCEQIFTSPEELEIHKATHENHETDEILEPLGLVDDDDLPPMIPVATELFEEHVKEDVKEKFACDLCGREYGSFKSLREHTRVKHPEHHISRKSEYPKQCEYCDRVCLTGASMALHKQMHERMMNEGRAKTVKAVKKSSDNGQDDESYHTCKYCFKVFSSRYNLKEHLKCHGVKHQKKAKPATSKKHTCDSCDGIFESLDELNAHKLEAHENEGSENSDEMPVLTNEADADQKIPVNIYTCDTCVLTFPSKTAMRKHKETHKISQNPIVQKTKNTAVYCKYCRIAFNDDTALSKHMEIEHEMKPKTKKLKVDDKLFKCPTCKKGFNTLAAMNAHAGWHKRGIAKYLPPPPTTPQGAAAMKQEKQTKVVKKLAAAAASKADTKGVAQVSEHQCSTCLIELPNETALRIHVLEKHENVSEVMLVPRCNTCNLDFHTHDEYEKHLRFHDFLERQKRHEMEVAQQRPPTAVAKPRHPCKYCPSEFSRSDTLTGHMKQKHPHLLEIQFKCNQCDRVFDKQNSLSIHLKVHEKQKVTTMPTAVVGGGTGKFACSICNRKFDLPKELRDHTITDHPF